MGEQRKGAKEPREKLEDTPFRSKGCPTGVTNLCDTYICVRVESVHGYFSFSFHTEKRRGQQPASPSSERSSLSTLSHGKQLQFEYFSEPASFPCTQKRYPEKKLGLGIAHISMLGDLR